MRLWRTGNTDLLDDNLAWSIKYKMYLAQTQQNKFGCFHGRSTSSYQKVLLSCFVAIMFKTLYLKMNIKYGFPLLHVLMRR